MSFYKFIQARYCGYLDDSIYSCLSACVDLWIEGRKKCGGSESDERNERNLTWSTERRWLTLSSSFFLVLVVYPIPGISFDAAKMDFYHLWHSPQSSCRQRIVGADFPLYLVHTHMFFFIPLPPLLISLYLLHNVGKPPPRQNTKFFIDLCWWPLLPLILGCSTKKFKGTCTGTTYLLCPNATAKTRHWDFRGR